MVADDLGEEHVDCSGHVYTHPVKGFFVARSLSWLLVRTWTRVFSSIISPFVSCLYSYCLILGWLGQEAGG
ncbi:hypothetical protein JCM18909_3994 [Cutibacterium acnes JCM 18909]|nr:hypothetical protein JCM18909_3994 [Cutibacterium acnes JCM 18909]